MIGQIANILGGAMSKQSIQRVDDIPLILHWLKAMGVQETIDSVWHSHGNWERLSLGQLGVLFLTYVLHSLNHRLYGMETWLTEHRLVLEAVTGWQIHPKDATDDRLGRMLGIFGGDQEQAVMFQQRMGQHMIQAYKLPGKIARYDTTSFSVHHAPERDGGGFLRFGHSKDHRPDLLQFKQGLGTLDPAGIPLVTHTLAGNLADDPLYVGAWQELCATLDHCEFLFIADCKAAAHHTRATIDKGGGSYLFPLPMTGDTPKQLQQWVLNPPTPSREIYLADVLDKEGKPRRLGQGFIVTKEIEARDGIEHLLKERWLITQSATYAETQQKAFQKRLEKAQQEIGQLKPKKDENLDQFRARAEKILKHRRVEHCLSLQLEETVTRTVKHLGRGRPGPNRPSEVIEKRQIQVHCRRNEVAIEQELQLAGWRIFVTNAPQEELSLEDSVRYYRNEWLVERGFHRFKKGSLPALPIYLQLPERITGLMLLLTVALQAVTLLEFVMHRSLAQQGETLPGLVPGNPKMKTQRPTAERILDQFDNLHLLIKETPTRISAFIVEELSPLHSRIIQLLGLTPKIYDLTFKKPKFLDSS